MERRKRKEGQTAATDKGIEIPVDYAKMVAGVFDTNFSEGLDILRSHRKDPVFKVEGVIYADEVLLGVSLIHKDQIAATSAYASVDFDPTASHPKAEDLLAICVDTIASFYALFLDPKEPEKIAQLAEHSLSSFDDVPFDWSGTKIQKRTVFLRVDKANPELEKKAEDWLKSNDPNYEELQAKNEKDAKDLLSERLDESDSNDIADPSGKKKTIH